MPTAPTTSVPASAEPENPKDPQELGEQAQGVSAWQAVRRHRLPAALVTIACTLLGVGAALGQPTTTTGEFRLAVGQGEMSALNIPGYPTATKDLASNYARWVTDQGVAGMRLPDGVTSLQASPLPDSSVIRIEATAADPDDATRGAKTAADALTAEVGRARAENDTGALLAEITANAPGVARVDSEATAALARYNRDVGNDAAADVVAADLAAYAAANAARVPIDVQQDARKDRYRRLISTRTTEAQLFPVTEQAYVTGDDRARRVQRFGMVGFGLGVVLSLLLSSGLERRRRDTAA